MNNVNKVKDAIRCQAIGDALGYKYEFIQCKGITDIDYVVSGITDDTQMVLYGLEAIYNSIKQVRPLKSCLIESYVAWYSRQSGEILEYSSELSDTLSLNRIRAPGFTCMDACYDLMNGEVVQNDSMGCGAVMRVVPFMLLDNYKESAVMSGLLTHKHHEVKPSIEKLMNIYDESVEYVIIADHISDLGEGWISPECVNMAAWAVYSSDTFEEMLRKSILHKGDSDSVAAVACSIWGYIGRDGWQKYYPLVRECNEIDYFLNLYTSL